MNASQPGDDDTTVKLKSREFAGADARAYVIHWFVSRTARHLPSTFSSTTVAPE